MTQSEELFDLRKKVLDGEDVSAEEYSRVIEAARKSRTASEAKPRGKKKEPANTTPIDFDALAGEITGKSG